MEDSMFSCLIDMENKVQSALGIAGLISGVLFHLTPMNVFLRAVKKDSSGEISITRYFMTYANCYFSMWAASCFSNAFAGVTNIINVWISFFWYTMFLSLSPTNLEDKRVAAYTGLVVVCLVYLLVYFSMNAVSREVFTGFLATTCSIVVYTSSLISVIKTEELKLTTSILMFLNGAFWFAFGLLEQDLFFVVSNGFGCGVGALQMYFIYQNNKGETINQKEKGKTKAKTA